MSKSLVSTELIAFLYKELGNCAAVANATGLCSQSVHERLTKLGVINKKNYLSESDKAAIAKLYHDGFERNDGQLDSLVVSLNRTKQFIGRYAKTLGLTKRTRIVNEVGRAVMAKNAKETIVKNGHPKGMLGKKHNKEGHINMCNGAQRYWSSLNAEQRKEKANKRYQARILGGKPFSSEVQSKARSWKFGWYEIGGMRHFYRSRWEVNYARVLQWLLEHGEILRWEPEPERFQFTNLESGCRSYLPDFKVLNLDGSYTYHEVKGWLDERSQIIFRLMAIEYPAVEIKIIDAAWFKENIHFKYIINEWEA